MAHYPELHEAIIVNAEIFNQRVKRALAERAIGFYVDDYTYRRTTEEERRAGHPEFELVPSHRKFIPADVAASTV